VSAQPLFRLPKHAFIYGIAYDAFGFVIYSFFPRVLRSDDGGFPGAWGYGCATVDPKYAKVFQFNDTESRLEAIQALLVVQRHAITLSEKLWNMYIPEELRTCHELWDKAKLW